MMIEKDKIKIGVGSTEIELNRRREFLNNFKVCTIPDNEILINLGLFLTLQRYLKMHTDCFHFFLSMRQVCCMIAFLIIKNQFYSSFNLVRLKR